MIGVVNTENKTSHDRAKQLYTSSVYAKFIVIYDIKVSNPYKYRKIIHKNIDRLRCNNKRQFFRCKPEDIKEYFLMENLVETFADIHDFPPDYFTQYVGINTLKIYRKDEIKIIDFGVNKINKIKKVTDK